MQFEEKDFIGCGQYVVRTKDAYVERTGYLSTIMFKVGYAHLAGEQINALISMADGFTLLGTYGDGQFNKFETKQQLIEFLNKGNSYRKATHEEVLRVVFYNGNR